MSVQSIYRWHAGVLEPLDYCDMTDVQIVAADSWLVTDGTALALDLHRSRFLESIEHSVGLIGDPTQFWDAALEQIPRDGDWFPRVELHSNGRFVLRLRTAPERTRSVVLATFAGPDPRTHPSRKGPDLEAMLRIRTSVRPADEAVILSPEGAVIEGAYSALVWWRGEILCCPSAELHRVDSVTARALLTLARALGFDTHEESVPPHDLDSTELWALSALHGIRIATKWIDGPALAERPGRLQVWRGRLDALRRPLP